MTQKRKNNKNDGQLSIFDEAPQQFTENSTVRENDQIEISPQDFSNRIRRTAHNGKVHFSLVDAMAEFNDLDTRPDVLLKRTYARLSEDGFQPDQNVIKLKLKATDGKMRLTDCADLDTCLRVIQSIPSPKAEPIRQWMAQVARERIEEAANPELGIERARERAIAGYIKQGHSKEWAEARVEGKFSRRDFTESVKAYIQNMDYGAVTNGVYKGVIGMTASKAKEQLGLPAKKSLRDGLSRVAVLYIGIAEAVCSEKLKDLGENDPVPLDRALYIIDLLASKVGVQAQEIADALDIDLISGQRLLKE